MNTARIAKLQEFLAQDPHDPFLLYGLAIEYRGHDHAQAMQYFDRLLAEHPDYTGTYYHAAALCLEMGQRERAAELYAKGLQVCAAQGDRHALRELQQAYNAFLYEDEDDC